MKVSGQLFDTAALVIRQIAHVILYIGRWWALLNREKIVWTMLTAEGMPP
jgi:hypothetical protein